MEVISYGFSKPEDLFEKLRRDATKLTAQPNPDDVFNFLVTAASLSEWVRKYFAGVALVEDVASSVRARDWKTFPVAESAWLLDVGCIPNRHLDERHHIVNALRLCWDVAGASKHFYWEGHVKDIQPEPIVSDSYQYFYTAVEPDLYVDYDGEAYGLSQIRGIVLQFYEQLLLRIRRETRGADA
jgi:hypothetical protein